MSYKVWKKRDFLISTRSIWVLLRLKKSDYDEMIGSPRRRQSALFLCEATMSSDAKGRCSVILGRSGGAAEAIMGCVVLGMSCNWVSRRGESTHPRCKGARAQREQSRDSSAELVGRGGMWWDGTMWELLSALSIGRGAGSCPPKAPPWACNACRDRWLGPETPLKKAA